MVGSSIPLTNPTKDYMELDVIYKTRIGTSHEAALQAVFEAGQESVFLPSEPAPADAAPIPALLKTTTPNVVNYGL